MKRKLLTALTGMLCLGLFITPTLAAVSTKDVTITYDTNSIPDPDNPANADWAVTIPKSFIFTDAALLNDDMAITLTVIKNGGLTDSEKVPVSVRSRNGYQLLNESSAALTYTLKYGNTTMSGTNSQLIGDLTKASPTIIGKSELTKAESIKANGTHKDVLTYTVFSSEAK